MIHLADRDLSPTRLFPEQLSVNNYQGYYRRYRMKEIQLTRNQVALVDDDMYEELNQFKWFANKGKKTFYARRMAPTINGKQGVIHMHHEVMGKPPKGLMPDHEDGNGCNNQRYNLRFVTNRQNSQNKKNVKGTSKYPGVDWNKHAGKWHARIQINGKTKHLGIFADEEEAFEVYQNAVNALGETVIGEI